MKRVWLDEERYDDNYREVVVNHPKGVGGVILPNNLTLKETDEYCRQRSGEVIIIREGKKKDV